MIWTTRDGREIDIKDMTTSHLTNARNMIKHKIVSLEISDEYEEATGDALDFMLASANGIIDQMDAELLSRERTPTNDL